MSGGNGGSDGDGSDGTRSWRDELASLMEDTGIRYIDADDGDLRADLGIVDGFKASDDQEEAEKESLSEQLKGFLAASGEMLRELGRGCWDIAQQQSIVTEDSYIVKKIRGPCSVISARLEFLNEFLPEDRDPKHSWPVVIFVFFLAIAGIPGIKASLLEEFGVRLVTYDLPGFGESDPHPHRNLNSSAFDMLNVADAVGLKDKFWVLGYSGGGMHAWAAIRYIPDRLAGAIMLAPMGNPYESSMTKEEIYKTWEKWTTKRKLMFTLARRFPSLLPYFYRRSFLSGKQSQPVKWLSLPLGKKDRELVDDPIFIEFLKNDIEESIRQGDPKPFVEEAVLQVSNWGFDLADLQVEKHDGKGFFQWIKSMYSQAEHELAGFLGPIHIWQGTDDWVVPPSMTEYVRRVVPGATVHRVHGEGHFSYFCFCDECHRQIFSVLFGIPQGPLPDIDTLEDPPPSGSEYSEEPFHNFTLQE
ncbi:hypothetical protein QJS10_CPB21g01206 [Acorus calamus]|uniref:AB hydrolase-1 domain-containing protein n=1 Tax=Acorus calamus TaxID=4465 RepID=A0AAV9C352_ACOCL|nr:hypothetical protein QJS10_CPB21g01206 [Acorus calamus]